MKNPVTTITGIVQLVVTIIASIFPALFGIDWANIEIQQAIVVGVGGIASGIVSLLLIFRAGDKDGGA